MIWCHDMLLWCATRIPFYEWDYETWIVESLTLLYKSLWDLKTGIFIDYDVILFLLSLVLILPWNEKLAHMNSHFHNSGNLCNNIVELYSNPNLLSKYQKSEKLKMFMEKLVITCETFHQMILATWCQACWSEKY